MDNQKIDLDLLIKELGARDIRIIMLQGENESLKLQVSQLQDKLNKQKK